MGLFLVLVLNSIQLSYQTIGILNDVKLIRMLL